MSRMFNARSGCLLVSALTFGLLEPFSSAYAKDGFSVLYRFKGGSDGNILYSGLVADQAGNLYGTTLEGGDMSCSGNEGAGCGTVFMIAPGGTKIVLHAFMGGSDGAYPFGGVIVDEAGNLYGTTGEGGSDGCDGGGCGTVFKLSTDGSETILHSFQGGADGAGPEATLIVDEAGNLYGTTYSGGGKGNGGGTVFKIAPDSTETIFRNLGGQNPEGGVVMDAAGNLYGTTSRGGDDPTCNGNGNDKGCGVVFKISPKGNTTKLHTFLGYSDGAYPLAGPILDRAGNLYGTTWVGGAYDAGTIYKIDFNGTETILYNFTDGADGWGPRAGLIMDKVGNLYGTTSNGGSPGCGDPFASTCGTVFKLATDGALTELHSFRGGRDGAQPFAALVADQFGNLYGTTIAGGDDKCPSGETYGCGTVFTLRR